MKELTLSPNDLKVLSILISSRREQNLHTLAAAAGLSVMGISKIVKKLGQRKLVTAVTFGRSYLIKLNLSPSTLIFLSLAEQYKLNRFLEKHHSLRGVIAQLREKLAEKAHFSLIFGSYASGEESTKSDLDILIAASRKAEALKIMRTVSALVTIEISPIVVTLPEFLQKSRQKHRLYYEINDGKRIMISGEYEYWKSVMDR